MKKISLLPMLIILGATTSHAQIYNVSDDTLLSIWKQRDDLRASFPEVAQGDLVHLKKWAATTGWNEDKRLVALIPPGKVPSYLDGLLLSIWKERGDLQTTYPEVAQGNLDRLKQWATTTGWDQEQRLSLLTPNGMIPSYQKNVLLKLWKNVADLQRSYPEVAQGNLVNLKKWAATTGWNEDKRLAALIPPGKVPKYLDKPLLSILKERSDLQKSYPEVAKGDLTKLKNWATTTGWNEDKRLTALIPPGKVPKYLDNQLLSIWEERAYLQKLYPEVAKGDLTKLKNWATTTGWSEDPRLDVLTPVYISHQDPSSFPIPDNVLLSIWHEKVYLQSVFPEVAKGNLDNLKKWATIFGWNEDKRLVALIPPGKVPKYLDKPLLSILKERSDLQKSYPEVAKGDLSHLIMWAKTTGWNEDKRLTMLIPPGKVPSYFNNILLSIWKERPHLQSAFPEVKNGNLDNLKKWAATYGWNEDKRLSALIPPGKIPQHLVNP